MLELFVVFFKIGITTFGGGYAMIPILTREIAEKKKWASVDELLEYYAIGQATPGLIGVNTSTFVGYKVGGVLGGVVATLGFVAPSILIISLLYGFIDILGNKFHTATELVKVVVTGLIIHTLYHMAIKQLSNVKKILLAIISTILVLIGVDLPIIIIFAALFAILEAKCKRY